MGVPAGVRKCGLQDLRQSGRRWGAGITFQLIIEDLLFNIGLILLPFGCAQGRLFLLRIRPSVKSCRPFGLGRDEKKNLHQFI